MYRYVYLKKTTPTLFGCEGTSLHFRTNILLFMLELHTLVIVIRFGVVCIEIGKMFRWAQPYHIMFRIIIAYRFFRITGVLYEIIT